MSDLVSQIGYDRMAQYTGESAGTLKERLSLSEQEAGENFGLIYNYRKTASPESFLEFESIADDKGELEAWKIINTVSP